MYSPFLDAYSTCNNFKISSGSKHTQTFIHHCRNSLLGNKALTQLLIPYITYTLQKCLDKWTSRETESVVKTCFLPRSPSCPKRGVCLIQRERQGGQPIHYLIGSVVPWISSKKRMSPAPELSVKKNKGNPQTLSDCKIS